MSEFHRTMISITKELKARMDKAGETTSINWSEVARDAFEAKLNEVYSAKPAAVRRSGADDLSAGTAAGKQCPSRKYFLGYCQGAISALTRKR